MSLNSALVKSTLPVLVALAALLVGLPLLGVATAGRDLAPYLAFPPAPVPVQHAPFSWSAFTGLAMLIVLTVAPFVWRVLASGRRLAAASIVRRRLPWWGWLGGALLGAAWLLAWSRFPWFASAQAHTFTPIWLGYILLINGLALRRTGHCMLVDRPRYFLALFPLSALFWWFFEFLNRFVQNWHYVGGVSLDPWGYFWQSTLPFSTVLPAVLGTRDYLASFPRLGAGLHRAWRIPRVAPRPVALLTLVAASAALLGLGIWPQRLYPLVWVAPLLVLISLQALAGRRTILAPLARGDWRGLWHAVLAALVCGILWELWNVASLAHWEYTIPYVHRFEVFFMPVLGYAGYLPFGLECLAVARLIERD